MTVTVTLESYTNSNNAYRFQLTKPFLPRKKLNFATGKLIFLWYVLIVELNKWICGLHMQTVRLAHSY